MQVLQHPQALRKKIKQVRRRGLTVGFVPTMGYLHEGHLSLVRKAKRENDLVVVSIFVNPLQFGPREDFDSYPRDLARDRRLLQAVKTDFLFVPGAKDFYPDVFQTRVEVLKLSRPLCGKTRPIHFSGVATVVLKLLHWVQPDVLYLGQKDYQQCRVVEQMVRDLNLDVRVKRVPTSRESDGLAMSSRNVRLDESQRKEAVILYQTLKKTRDKIRSGQTDRVNLERYMKNQLRGAQNARVDYASILDADTLGPMVKLKKGMRVVLALAVCFSKIRLIDNLLIRV